VGRRFHKAQECSGSTSSVVQADGRRKSIRLALYLFGGRKCNPR